MGRYTGPKHKLSRRFQENLGGYAKTPLARKPYKPGVHGPNQRRRKESTYGLGMKAKQHLKALYNIREKTLLRIYDRAIRKEGNTGENLMQFLECRLDNMVYRMGLALTPRCARQLVAHGHILVDGKRTDIASYTVSPGQEISIAEGSKKHPQSVEAVAQYKDLVNYVRRDDKELKGTLLTMPKREDIPVHLEERLVVEFLAR
ncbi:MAG: 30S ribosomal protein S4 [Planctomycetes bacterium]|nr:30S ribosomal protein S4 [Planctomycetota bacterium]